MKAILFLTLLIIGALAATTDSITETTPAFIVGTWFLSGLVDVYNPPGQSCCMPYGTIVITPDTANASQSYMTSNVWVGERCKTMGINSTYNMSVPIPWNQTWNELYNPAALDTLFFDQQSDSDVDSQGIVFLVEEAPVLFSFQEPSGLISVQEMSDSEIWPNSVNWSNGTQRVEITFYMDYANDLEGNVCAIIMSKDTSPVA